MGFTFQMCGVMKGLNKTGVVSPRVVKTKQIDRKNVSFSLFVVTPKRKYQISSGIKDFKRKEDLCSIISYAKDLCCKRWIRNQHQTESTPTAVISAFTHSDFLSNRLSILNFIVPDKTLSRFCLFPASSIFPVLFPLFRLIKSDNRRTPWEPKRRLFRQAAHWQKTPKMNFPNSKTCLTSATLIKLQFTTERIWW